MIVFSLCCNEMAGYFNQSQLNVVGVPYPSKTTREMNILNHKAIMCETFAFHCFLGSGSFGRLSFDRKKKNDG